VRVNVYEKFWMGSAAAIIVVFLGATVVGVMGGRTPPSHVETIHPAAAMTDPRFAERGVVREPDGRVVVTALALMFAFQPNEIRVPARTPITFRITSPDVTHGFQIVGTNGNTMVIPGYVSQFTITFDRPDRYLIVCNEYCGLGHHIMSGTLIVEEAP
jgi:cytochrome c oxidase subunit 2